jgi:hypothetical protein
LTSTIRTRRTHRSDDDLITSRRTAGWSMQALGVLAVQARRPRSPDLRSQLLRDRGWARHDRAHVERQLLRARAAVRRAKYDLPVAA